MMDFVKNKSGRLFATLVCHKARGGMRTERFNIFCSSCRRQIHFMWVIGLILRNTLAS